MLITTNLSIGSPGDPLLENINLSLDSSKKLKVALVGPNGSGKSTLLKTLAGLEEAQSGSINTACEKIVYLSQHPTFPENQLVGEILESQLENEWESYKIEMVLKEVGLGDEMILQEPKTLSGGEKLRLQLAILLLSDPTIILMDEPSNHLDANGIEWLIEFISDFSGTIILVSHHRGVLNRTVNLIWEIDTFEKNLVSYPGNYDFWVAERARIRAQKEERRNQLMAKVEEIRRWLKEKEFHPKFRFSDIVMKHKKKLFALEEEAEKFAISKENPILFSVKESVGKKKLRLIAFEIEKPGIFSPKKGAIYAGSRVRIAGPNGSGKTTLLRILAGEDQQFSGTLQVAENIRIGWLRQQCSLDLNRNVENTIRSVLTLTETEYWQLLARYSLKSMQNAPLSTLSGGEQKRVEMALLTASNPDILLLDEPTNHLDIYVQEELQEFLMEVNQTIIYVSHDPFLVGSLGNDLMIEM